MGNSSILDNNNSIGHWQKLVLVGDKHASFSSKNPHNALIKDVFTHVCVLTGTERKEKKRKEEEEEKGKNN